MPHSSANGPPRSSTKKEPDQSDFRTYANPRFSVASQAEVTNMNRVWIAIGLAVIAAVIPLGYFAAAAVPDPITEWSMVAQTAAAAAGMAPLRTPITFAILHLAMYDAVNAITRD